MIKVWKDTWKARKAAPVAQGSSTLGSSALEALMVPNGIAPPSSELLPGPSTTMDQPDATHPLADRSKLCQLWEICVDSLAVSMSMDDLVKVPRWAEKVDPASFMRMLSKDALKANKELEVASAFLEWAETPGRGAGLIDKIAPLVRWPLINLCPPDESIRGPLRRVMQRSAVTKSLVAEGYELQRKVGLSHSGTRDHLACFTPQKHKLIDGKETIMVDGKEMTVPRHKKRKLCHDAVPAVSLSDIVERVVGY